ncbi:hypothetical protein O0L34_g5457 [Tuta absoluta]|nr:hypothetical protein O0L34_g5457 [Tuta absoluta]
MRVIICLNLCFLLFLTVESGLVLDMVDKMKSGVNSVVDWKVNAIKNIGDKVNSAIDGVGCLVGKNKHKIVITENDIHNQEEFEGEKISQEHHNVIGPYKEEIKNPQANDNKVGYSDDNVEIDIRIRA